ncbi:transferase [Ascochyta rabiei]|uniref:Transferase n=1 Tax=Didymella rabiei TaxID=5454 RepID=A0A162Z5M4_DIDRA|nr:transferase [Ascochyta rabiei]
MTASSNPSAPPPLAIVGMSCRMPGGVHSLEDFWSLLANSKDGYKEFPQDRFHWEAYYHPNQGRKDSINVHHGYFLDGDVSEFDAGFFKMNAIDATSFDPQGRIILECVYEALENAGVPKESIAGTKVGVFSTSNTSDYTLELKDDTPSMPSMVGVLGHNCMLSNVVSNVFDLRGPSVSVDTACSSAFYALQMAAQSLRAGETDMCIVSGCALNLSPWRWTMLSNLTMLHPDGTTKALDPSADSGYARGEGAASIILKPLDKALRDNDRIHCVLSHIGVNHNGHTNGYTMPDAAMQATLMEELQAQIDIKPDEFGFVEAHAPGTRVGDPIEISALQKVFSSDARSPENPLLIGSVKANVGHLESSSGFPSLIKAALMLGKRQVVPNANFKDEAMNTELRKLSMAVPVSTQAWPEGKSYIAINNYGFGGSNAHAIIKAAPVSEAHADKADTPSGDESFLEQLVEFLESEDAADVKIHDLAYTLGQRRSQLSWRCAIVASNLDDLSIQTASPRLVQRRVARQPKIAFAFTGQGAQYFALEMCSACVESFGANFSLLEELYGNEKTSRIDDADVSQAASTAIQISIVDLLRSWGVEPMAVVGHSSGEVAAAYAAGLLSLPGAMRIAYARGQMAIRIKKVEPDFKGGMLAVAAGLEDVVPLLDIVMAGKVVIACENSPKSITVSGDEAALEELESLLEEDGLPHRRLAVDFPYHSPFLEPFVDRYEQDLCAVDTFADTKQKAEYFSAMAGRRVDAAAIQKPSYWANSAKFRVRFTSATTALLKSKTPPDVIVEIGPHPMLTGAVKSILKAAGKQVTHTVETLASLQRGQVARTCMVKLAEGLFSMGQTMDLEQVNVLGGKENGSRPRLVDGLRPYPWTRNRYWIESRIRDDAMLRRFPRHDLLGYANKGASGEGAWSWRNNFQVEDVPWLRDYQVGPHTTFPLAGYACAALEASKQRALARGAEVLTGFTVRELRILNRLVLEEGARVELIATLHPLAEEGYEAFELSSWKGEDVAVAVAVPACSPLLYQGSAKNGPVRTGVFRNVHNLRFGGGKTTAEVVVSDTAAEMPLQHESNMIIHPSTLDGLLQCGGYLPFLDESLAPVGGSSNVWVPDRVQEVTVLVGSGEMQKADGVLRTVARVDDQHSGTYSVHGVLDGAADSRVWVRGLHLGVEESLAPQWPAPHYGCYKLDWQPAGELMGSQGGQPQWHVMAADDGPHDGPLAGLLGQELDQQLGGTVACGGEQGELPSEARWCIVLDVGEGLLGSLSEAAFSRIKQALTTCMAVGLLRTIRSEMQAAVATLDLDPRTAGDAAGQAALVARVAGHVAACGEQMHAQAPAEMEFSEQQGTLLVSRITPDEQLDATVHAATGVVPPRPDVFNADTRGAFTLQRPGMAESLYLRREDTAVAPPLAEGEVEVRVAAVAVPLDADGTPAAFGGGGGGGGGASVGFSGSVVRCGSSVSRVQPGDSVFGWAHADAALGTFARAPETNVARTPDALDHAAAAALPATLAAAQLALVDVGRLCPGERALILGADSALGRAAVHVAKAAGADVFAALAPSASSADREAVAAAGVLPDHIVSALHLDAAPPADLVFRPSPAALASTLTPRLAPFGRFVYAETADTADTADTTHRARATPRLAAGCSAARVDLAHVAATLPQRIAAVLDAVAGLFARGLVSSAPAVRTVGLERLSQALSAPHPSPDAETLVLVPTPGEMVRTTPARPAPPTFDPAAVYLLIGGGGGLGRVIAQWMVDSGAKHVGLLSRSTSMSPEVRVLVDNAATQGANIFLLPCDVTNREQLQKATDQCTAERGPIKGVINAAMVFKGAVFSSVSHADFMDVAHPKVAGTWNLHHALNKAPLDFFVLISSVAGVMGTAGHSAYAAANTFLDSFARYRMRQGLPASSLALTAVVDAGYMAENTEKLQKLKYVDEFAGEILTTADVLALLAAAVKGEVASSCHGYAITGAGFGTARKLPAHAKDPRFSTLLSHHAKEQAITTNTTTATSNDSSLARALDQADDKDEATRRLLNAIRSKVAELQLIPVADIFDHQTIVELGLDSLTAMELYSWIGRLFRMKFRVQEYAKLDTLEKIADCVMAKREAVEAP